MVMAEDKTVLEYLDDIEDIVIHSFAGYPYTEDEQTILDTLSDARAAVEFRVAKKPIDTHKIREVVIIGKCPVCNEGVNDAMRACAYCGQLLDWSNING